jgi:hypothetical protein
MKHAFHFTLALGLLAFGCASEPDKKPDNKKAFLELKIQSPLVRTLSVDGDGNVADVISGSGAKGKLAAADLKALQDLAAKVEWAKLPADGFKTASGTPVDGGRIYDLTYSGSNLPKPVHSMDGAEKEDESFKKLRDTIETDVNKAAK